MKIAELSIKRRVGTILITLSVVVIGLLSIPNIPVSFWPEFVAPSLIIIAPYPGVAPLEVEEQIAKPLEEELSTIDGVEELETTCMEGMCQVLVRFGWGIDFDDAKLKVQERTNKARSRFPREALEPRVLQVQDFLPPGIELGFNSDQRDLNEVRDYVETKLKNRFLRLENVATVQTFGGYEQQVAVKVDPDRLYAYGLTLGQVTAALASENLNVPAGKIQSELRNYFIRIVGKFSEVEDIENIIVAANNGVLIYLKDIAQVTLENKEQLSVTRLNGKLLIGLAIREKSGGNTVAMCDEVKEELKTIKKILPQDIQVTIIRDQSLFIKKSIQNVLNNAAIGALLASIVLLIFLGSFRNTLIIMLSIPISIIATFFLIDWFGLTINTISLGGLALGVGMIVDASVVVIENIFRNLRERRGEDRFTTVVNATSEVASAITSSTLTSVVVFFPLAFLVGLFAVLLGELALTIVFALSISVIVALTIVPLLSFRLMKIELGTSRLGFVVRAWQNFFERLTQTYRASLRWALGHRLLTIFLAVLVLVLSIAIFPRLLDVELLPSINQGEFRVELTLAEGTRLEFTDAISQKVESEILQRTEVDQVYSVIGVASARGDLKSNFAAITVNLKPQFVPQIQSIMEDIRNRYSSLVGTKVVVRQIEVTEGMKQMPVNVRIAGDDLAVLEEIGARATNIVKEVPGVVNLTSSLAEGLSEFSIRINRLKAADLGLSNSQIAGAVRLAVLGSAATRLSSFGKEYDITVSADASKIKDVNELLDLPLTTMKGSIVPLRAVAEVSLERAPSEIKRFDQQRVIEIKADVAGRNQRQVVAEVRNKLASLNLPSDYFITYGGQSRAIADSFKSLLTALVIAIFLVYVVMGTQFNSFLHPFTIAMTIPLALIGVFLGLFIFGAALSMNALLGSIMLVGIVVNNGILLIDFILQLRAKGMSKDEAIIEAGTLRLRPILITSLTTIFGMIPIALGLGEGGEALQPLGAVVIGGLTTSTFLTLLVIPCVYSLVDRLSRQGD
ncbi:MAG: efflux RND transporter permease subunit [candidate division KSB1 bacterium]|nr:efflux RND transporter permease subunit [candidate division KSB1 bacterium]